MVTLQETTAKFNNNLHVPHTGGRLMKTVATGYTITIRF